MRILMVGAGAVGGYFGALLVRAGVDLTFLVHPETQEAIQGQGLKIKSTEGDFEVRPKTVTNAQEAGPVDLIVLAVKCYDVDQALSDIKPALGEGTSVLTLQNGVDTEERVQAEIGADRVIAGVAYITSRKEAPGVIEHFRRGKITLGEISGRKTDRLLAVYNLFVQSGIPTHLSDDIRQSKWEKLCWNATFNPLSVILNDTVGAVLDSPELLDVVRGGVREVMAVASVLGIKLSERVVEETITASEQFRDYHTSMYEDFNAGKETEIEYLNGLVVQQGKEKGVQTPINLTLYALVKGLL
ncbi:MAG TPA: 2-dehydropantoate 2-reductase [Nitrospiria bacterium]|nr:2-dehydropantoate 2-reductase [Nitrospiria bacterium]